MPLHAIIMTRFRQIWNPGCYSSLTIIGNAGVGYTVGQTAELAAVGVTAAVSSKSSTTTSKNANPIKPKIRTTPTSSVKNVTVVSGRKKITSKVKKSVSRNKKFQRVCMA